MENTEKETNNEELIPPCESVLKNMISYVKPIKSVIEQKSKWNLQREKSGLLQHQLDSHRAYIYDHQLVKMDEKRKRVEIIVDRIKGPNYFNYIFDNKDIINEIEDECDCNNYDEIKKCKVCQYIVKDIASRSTGKKYDTLKLPKWNMTFRAGGLRSQNRVYYGKYSVKCKSELHSNCQSYITFSMLLPIKDPLFPKMGYWEEIALGFNSQSDKQISLFIKSSLSKSAKKTIINPINMDKYDSSFSIRKYNNYVLFWRENSITLLVNDREVYSTKPNHPVPQLPGYSYFLIRPNYNTDSVSLIRNIKREIYPNIYIKSFSYNEL